MTELPDRLSTNPRSPHFDAELLSKGVRIRLNGVEKTTVDEYCVSEGWVKLAAGKSRDRHGNPMTITLKGKVEAFLDEPEAPAEARSDADEPSA